MRKTERLVAITLLLQARGKMTAERLAGIMDVSVRTIYRDIEALSLAHVPVTMDYGPGGGYYLPDDYRLDPTTFSSDEAIALALGGTVAGDYRLFESDDGLRRALVKLEAALPEEYRADVRAARERILFDTTAWHKRPTTTPFLETVRAAVWGARQLDLLYPSSDGPDPRWRRVEPQGLVCKAGIWYLVAYCHMRKDFRTFRVGRVEDVRVREEAVKRRPGFDLQKYWEESRRRYEKLTMPFVVTLRVASPDRRRVLAAGRPTRADPADESVLHVDTEAEGDAVELALSLGAEVEVLAPPAVRAAVATAARATAALYMSSRALPLHFRHTSSTGLPRFAHPLGTAARDHGDVKDRSTGKPRRWRPAPTFPKTDSRSRRAGQGRRSRGERRVKMFCPRCGTKATTNSPRFCYECGAEIPPAGETRASGTEEGFDRAGDSGPKGCAGAPPAWDPRVMTHVFARDRSWRPILIAGGLLLLLPLAIPLIFGAVVASAFAGIALVALLVKALPVIAIVALVYWALSRPRRYMHQSR